MVWYTPRLQKWFAAIAVLAGVCVVLPHLAEASDLPPLSAVVTDQNARLPEALDAIRAGKGFSVPFDVLSNLGLKSHHTVWVSGRFDGMKDGPEDYLSLSWSDADAIKVFYLDENFDSIRTEDIDTARTPGIGVRLPWHGPALRASSFVVRIDARNHLALKPRVVFVEAETLSFGRQQSVKLLMIFFVFLCSVGGLIAYLITDQIVAAFFSSYAFGMAFLLFEYSGLGNIFFWGKDAYLDRVMFPFVHYAAAGAVYLFLKEFLQTKQRAPRAHKGLLAMTGACVIGALASLVDPQIMTASVPFLGAVSVAVVLIAVLGVFKESSFHIRLYLVSLVIFLGFVVPYTLTIAGILGDHFLFGFELPIGTVFNMCVLLVAMYLKMRDVVRAQVIEHQKNQRRLEQTTRLTSLGMMAGGIAHEINNPLAIIKAAASNAEFMLERGKLDLTILGQTQTQIISTVERIAKIIDSLRILARDTSEVTKEDLSVLELFESTFVVSGLKLAARQVSVDLSQVPPNFGIRCDKGQLSQVLLNLLSNAFDAIGENAGWIRISTRRDGPRAVIEITNSGSAISKEAAAHIFEPFFTTKPVGVGTGLGLSICKAIVAANDGDLHLAVDREHTTFVITLEASKKPLSTVSSAAS